MKNLPKIPFGSRIVAQFLRVFFRLLYHQFAWSYDLVASIVSVGLWKGWVLSTCEFLPGLRILELGFGPGHLQNAIDSPDIEIYGLDASHQMCRIASRRLKNSNRKQRLVLGSSTNLPYRNHWFDQVVATFPTEYIFLPETILEMKRVIKPDGKIIILFQARITGGHPFLRAADWLFRVTGQYHPLDPEKREQVIEPFTNAGFSAQTHTIGLEHSEILFVFAKIGQSNLPN